MSFTSVDIGFSDSRYSFEAPDFGFVDVDDDRDLRDSLVGDNEDEDEDDEADEEAEDDDTESERA